MRLAVAAAAAAVLAASAAASEPKIAAIEARLFYESTGRLSDNVAPPADFTFWNTLIGEGQAEEPASDVLLTVTVTGEPGSFVEAPLTIVVTGSDQKVVARREIKGLLLNAEGRTTRALLVPDTTCNPIDVKASIGKSASSVNVPFACGE